eukprot:551243-Pleurochrysis_carterae.AAC.1
MAMEPTVRLQATRQRTNTTVPIKYYYWGSAPRGQIRHDARRSATDDIAADSGADAQIGRRSSAFGACTFMHSCQRDKGRSAASVHEAVKTLSSNCSSNGFRGHAPQWATGSALQGVPIVNAYIV